MDSKTCFIMNKAEIVVCEYFSVAPDDILDKGHKTEQSIARGMLWYILHNDYSIATSVIANTYFRNRRGVFAQLAKTKSAIKLNRRYKIYYKEIREILDKELPLD